jgi:CheY-like chemotaxis protein
MLVLLVDDDADDQEIFREALDRLTPGYKCVTANNGEEALGYLWSAEQLPDLIFLDLNMPRMDGHETLRALKSNSTLCDIPVFILTTSDFPAHKDRAQSFGAQDILSNKPTSHRTLNRSLPS